MPELDYETLSEMKRKNSAWRMLIADSSPLVISFLNRAFILPNVRVRSEADLVEMLEDELYFLREVHGEDVFKRTSTDYLKEWAEPDKGWLRRFYPHDSDEPHYDVTPSVEKVISWIVSLSGSSFVGTESRLKTVFDLLRQMVQGSEADPDVRIAELKRRREEIDSEIARIENGEIAMLGGTELRDRFQQFSSTARELLSDFRAVEYNFRVLDRNVREQIARWDEGKGALLDEILGERDVIDGSDQGRSFYAFTNFLLSGGSQRELDDLLGQVMDMPAIKEMSPDRSLRRIHNLWLDASIHVQRVADQLSSQLRRFLEESVLLENRRIVEIFKKIQEHALDVRENQPRGNFMELDETSINIALMIERPLFAPKVRAVIESMELLAGDGDIDVSVLFEQSYVDISLLRERIERALRHTPQVTLGELLALYPPERGLAEVLAYMSIAAGRVESIFDESESELLEWRNDLGNAVEARAPRVIFTR